MVGSLRHDVASLASEFNVPSSEILLIAINLFGVNADVPQTRARLDITLYDAPDHPWRVIVPTNAAASPFTLSGGVLRIGTFGVGSVATDVPDDAVGGYFRWGGRAATVNPNARSRCVGCAFCPNTLEAASDPRATTDQTMKDLVAVLERAHPDGHLHSLAEVTISTGCYGTESAALAAVLRLTEALRERGSRPRIGLLSSVVTSREALRELSREVDGFILRLTVECFERRGLLLKQSKAALDLQDAVRIATTARDLGLDVSYTYVVGLDSSVGLSRGNETLLPLATRWPNFQVYQAHNAIMEILRDPKAANLRYYLEARMNIETTAKRYGLTIAPANWEGYRSLWYNTFAGAPIHE